MKILYVLQNAYRSERYGFRNREEWYEDLARSHSGRRLKEMIPVGHEIYVINATPEIGDRASSCYPPDIGYIHEQIAEIEPDVICGCGRMAIAGLEEVGVEFIRAPHPAWRALSKEHTQAVLAEIHNLI